MCAGCEAPATVFFNSNSTLSVASLFNNGRRSCYAKFLPRQLINFGLTTVGAGHHLHCHKQQK
jgi:hypothetical protein